MSFVSNIVGSLVGAKATRSAANTQADATRDAAESAAQAQRENIAEQRRQYDQAREDQTPFRDAGVESIGRLRSLLANDGPLFRRYGMQDFANDPVQQIAGNFALDEGRRAIERRSPMSGGFDSGSTLKALTRYGSDYGNQRANESYNRFNSDQTQQFNRLAAMSGIGQNATNQIGAAGSNAANAIGEGALNTGNALANLYAGLGNAQGAARIAQGNAYSNAFGSIGDYFGNNQRGSMNPYAGAALGSAQYGYGNVYGYGGGGSVPTEITNYDDF
jgi:hypothetical protein